MFTWWGLYHSVPFETVVKEMSVDMDETIEARQSDNKLEQQEENTLKEESLWKSEES